MDSETYAAGWGTLCLINAGVAQGKARRGRAWFFISLFLGPAATLLLVLLPFGETAHGPRTSGSQRT